MQGLNLWLLCISFGKQFDEKKENNLSTLIIKSKFSLLVPSVYQQLVLALCPHRVKETRFLTNHCVHFHNTVF